MNPHLTRYQQEWQLISIRTVNMLEVSRTVNLQQLKDRNADGISQRTLLEFTALAVAPTDIAVLSTTARPGSERTKLPNQKCGDLDLTSPSSPRPPSATNLPGKSRRVPISMHYVTRKAESNSSTSFLSTSWALTMHSVAPLKAQ